MKGRLDRAQLLAEIDAEYAALNRLIEQVPAQDLAASSVNSAGWSLKDVLAHIADWAQRSSGWCRAGLRGERPQPPAPGFKWNETPRLNREIFLRRRGHTASRVLRDFRTGHDDLVQLARVIDEADLCEPHRFAWTGPTWSVAKHIRANTAAHYRWAGKHFRKWVRSVATRPHSRSRK
ncbi:hypothetical protein PHYC_00102 [Phycisphaerales bacterium]|nr:hypothetical protein PHYC_00102 [Phycisphaerales bacterium]